MHNFLGLKEDFEWRCLIKMIQYLEVGKIVNTHGVRGEVKAIPLTDDPRRFDKLKQIYISDVISENMKKYDIESVKYHKSFVILKMKEVSDIDSAQKLKEQFIIIDRKDAVKLPKDTFFMCDLIDLEVFDEKGDKIGTVKEILKTGSNDVYVIEDENKNEILIPALKSVVMEISLENKKITVSLPQGLIDDEI